MNELGLNQGKQPLLPLAHAPGAAAVFWLDDFF